MFTSSHLLYWDAALKERPPLSDLYIKKRVNQIREGLGIESPIDCGVLVDRPEFPDWADDKRTVSQDNLDRWNSWEDKILRPYLQAARVCVLPGLMDTSARWAEAFMWGDFDTWSEIFGYGVELSAYDAYIDYLGKGRHIGLGALERRKGANSPNPPRRIDEFVCENERHLLADRDLPLSDIKTHLLMAEYYDLPIDPISEVMGRIERANDQRFRTWCEEGGIPANVPQEQFEALCKILGY